jgi:hypothetical protein
MIFSANRLPLCRIMLLGHDQQKWIPVLRLIVL